MLSHLNPVNSLKVGRTFPETQDWFFFVSHLALYSDKSRTVYQPIHLDAVGTIIAARPPHRTVRARLRIRLPPWMSGGEA